MAKKRIQTDITPIEELIDDTIVSTKVDPFAEKVRDLKAKGYDSNRIASLLGVHKQKVDSIL